MKDEIKEILYVLKHIVIGRASRLTPREAQTLLDYITNLQQENEELKKNKLTPDELANLLNQELIKQRDDYKSRCKKAIEYNKEIVNNYLEKDNCEYCDGRYATAKHNLNILQNGSDDNE